MENENYKSKIQAAELVIKAAQEQILQAQEQIDALEEERLREAIKKIKELMAELGVSPDDLLSPPKKKPKKSPPKFKNPANPRQTWNGRGRRPNWFVPDDPTPV